MTRYLFILIFVGWATSGARADTQIESLFDHRFWDLGSVPRAMTQHHVFLVTNKTDRPVRIANIRVSCGCVTATATKKQLAPGEQTTIVAQMETRQFTGPITKTIFVLFDQPRTEEVRLHVQANVLPDLTLTPNALQFGKIKKGNAPEMSTIVSFTPDQLGQIAKATSESGYVQVKVEPLTKNAGAGSYRVTAKLSPQLPAGSWYCTLSLVSARANQPSITIPLTVEVVP